MSTLAQRGFSGGEISPSLYPRCDLVKYLTGLRTARNGYTQKDGGLTNRAGTAYVYGNSGTAIGASTFLVPWEASGSNSTYILEIGNGFMRVIKNGALVTVSGVTAWSGGTSYVIGDLASRLGVNYYCVAAHTNHQPPNATYWYALDGSTYSMPFVTGAGLSFIPSYYKQNVSSMTFVSGEFGIYDLTTSGDTVWKLTAWVHDANLYGKPLVSTPQNPAVTNAGTAAAWAITAVASNLEESLVSSWIFGAAPSSGSPNTISWDASVVIAPSTASIRGYNVYRVLYGVPYFLGFAPTNSFTDNAFLVPSVSADNPPEQRPELLFSDVLPQVIGAYQQRTLIGNFLFSTFNGGQTFFCSKTGYPQNFSRKVPVANDDSIVVQLNARGLHSIMHFVDLGQLIIFTVKGEWVMDGDINGVLTPSTAVPRQRSENGANTLIPIVADGEALYMTAQGSRVMALSLINNGVRNSELSAFAYHMVRGHTIVAWAYQKSPDAIIWMVRDDGILVGFTYNKEQQILAWHRHDTDGFIENVVSVPEGNVHAVYIIVKRTINGSTKRYMERMFSRNYGSDIRDAVFMDSVLQYDGRNVGSTTMTLSGGTSWTYDETLTLTASASTFSAGDVGNEIQIIGTDGITYRFAIKTYSSATVMTGKMDKTVPSTAGLRSSAVTTWAKAVDQLSGLGHLEGKKVSVFGDGYVVANPNNAQYGTAITVASGAITLPACYAVISVGLPYLSDLETLDIDSAQGETLADKKKIVGKVTMHVEDTRGLWIGAAPPADDSIDPLKGLVELKIRESENYATPNKLVTDKVEVIIEPQWNSSGHVFVRQVDPLPMTILSIMPAGLFPFKAGG